jgi:hypothetical protein
MWLGPYNADRDCCSAGRASQVMGQAQPRVFQLPFTRAAENLVIHFVHHTKPGLAYGMTEAFETAVYVIRIV